MTKKNPHAVALGRLGGRATAQRLTPEQRHTRAVQAGRAGGLATARSLTPEQASARGRKMVAGRKRKQRV